MQTTRQTIVTDDMVGELMKLGPDYVKAVKEKHKEVSTAEKILADFISNGLKSAQEKLDEITGALAYEISLDGTLSNEAKRKAALTKALAEDEAYKKTTAEFKSLQSRKLELEQGVQIAKIELEAARNALSVWHTEMTVIAGLSREVAQSVEFHHHITSEVSRG